MIINYHNDQQVRQAAHLQTPVKEAFPKFISKEGLGIANGETGLPGVEMKKGRAFSITPLSYSRNLIPHNDH